MKKAPGAGAWLVRNSWGNNGLSQYGYFWLSYYDTSIADAAYIMSFDKDKLYSNLYQYDGCVTDSVYDNQKEISAANVFTAKSGAPVEKISAVALGISSADTAYQINVYKNPKDGNPTQGQKVNSATTNGNIQHAGIYTIKLKNPVMVQQKEKFSIVITLKNKNGAKILTESSYTAPNGICKSIANISKGQSYIKFGNGKWNDIKSLNNGLGNNRIKAYTNNIKFKDVNNEKSAFYKPIYWSVANGIATGLSSDNFGINNSCTRGQAVTFLWRSAGSPNPKSTNSSFKDVKKDSTFYKAIMWAIEKGVTTGFSDGTFKPDNVCTRGQIVTFLWRYADKPKANIKTLSYKDIKKNNNVFYDAILWATGNGIATGYSDNTFRQDSDCIRGQVVTFLYRYLNR